MVVTGKLIESYNKLIVTASMSDLDRSKVFKNQGHKTGSPKSVFIPDC